VAFVQEAGSAATRLKIAMDRVGTDKATVERVFEQYSGAELVQIMAAYKEKYGKSLMEMIQGDFSGVTEGRHVQRLLTALTSFGGSTVSCPATNNSSENTSTVSAKAYSNVYNVNLSIKDVDTIAEEIYDSNRAKFNDINDIKLVLAAFTEGRGESDRKGALEQFKGVGFDFEAFMNTRAN
jgi:hypothetical protein